MLLKKLLIMFLTLIHSNESEDLENKLKGTRVILQNIPYNKELKKYFPFLIKDPRIEDNKITYLDSPLEIINKFVSYYVEKKRNNNILTDIKNNQQEIDKLIQDPDKKQLLKATNNLHYIFEKKFGEKYYIILNKKINLKNIKTIYEMKNNIESEQNRNEIKLALEFLDSIKESINEKNFIKPKNQTMKIFGIILIIGIVTLYFYSSKKEEKNLENEVIINNN